MMCTVCRAYQRHIDELRLRHQTELEASCNKLTQSELAFAG